MKEYREIVSEMHSLMKFTHITLRDDYYSIAEKNEEAEIKLFIDLVESFLYAAGTEGGGLNPEDLLMINDTSRSIPKDIVNKLYNPDIMNNLADFFRERGNWNFKGASSISSEGASILKRFNNYLKRIENEDVPLGTFYYRCLVYSGEVYYWGIKYYSLKGEVMYQSSDTAKI